MVEEKTFAQVESDASVNDQAAQQNSCAKDACNIYNCIIW